MSDRELLELAAKAAGIDWCAYYPDKVDKCSLCLQPNGKLWNPLTDDGDALRLAVKLGISTYPYPIYNEVERHSVVAKQRRSTDTMRVKNPTECIELYNGDPCAATRRAIVRAAAEIGKEMK